MNALRWNPNGQPPSSQDVLFRGAYPLDPTINITVTAQLTISGTGTGVSQVPPYAESMSCKGATLGEKGFIRPNLPFEPFVDLYNPIRPLCSTQNVSSSQFTSIGDVKVRIAWNTNVIANVSVSGWINYGADFVLPTGFIKLKFIGEKTTQGILGSAFYITMEGGSLPLEIITPPVLLDPKDLIANSTQLAILKYNNATNITFISPSGWNSLNPYRLNVILPEPGIYIFGRLNSDNKILPSSLNSLITYFGDWQQKTFSLDAKFNLLVISNANINLTVTRPKVIVDPKTYTLESYYQIDAKFNSPDDSRAAQMKVSYVTKNSAVKWL